MDALRLVAESQVDLAKTIASVKGLPRNAALPDGVTTRISVARWRGVFQAGQDRDDHAWLVELGGFLVSGPSSSSDITQRFGRGSFRVSAYAFEPPGMRWEVLVEGLGA